MAVLVPAKRGVDGLVMSYIMIPYCCRQAGACAVPVLYALPSLPCSGGKTCGEYPAYNYLCGLKGNTSKRTFRIIMQPTIRKIIERYCAIQYAA